MNEHGVKMYGNERVCTGPHLWGEPSENGVIMCELCHECRMAKDVPKWEHRTAAREAIEESIRRYKDELHKEQVRVAQERVARSRNYFSPREKDIRTMLDSLFKELDKWR